MLSRKKKKATEKPNKSNIKNRNRRKVRMKKMKILILAKLKWTSSRKEPEIF